MLHLEHVHWLKSVLFLLGNYKESNYTLKRDDNIDTINAHVFVPIINLVAGDKREEEKLMNVLMTLALELLGEEEEAVVVYPPPPPPVAAPTIEVREGDEEGEGENLFIVEEKKDNEEGNF